MSAKVLPIRSSEPVWLAVPGIPYLKLHSESGIYYVRKYKAGKGQLFKTTGETTKGRARFVADEMITEWLTGRRQTTGRRQKVSAVCDELLEFLKSQAKNPDDRRSATWIKDQRMVRVISDLFGDLFVDDIDEDWWANWVAFEGRALGIQLFDHAKYLSKVLTFAHRRKYIQRKPKIENPDPEKPKAKKSITDEEIGKVVALAVSRGAVDLELQAVLGYENGFRPGEIRCLQWSMVSFPSKGAAIVDLPYWFVKSNARVIQVSDRAALLLSKLRNSKSPYVFPNPENLSRPVSRSSQARRWRRACKSAGVKAGRVVYSMRHGFYNKTLLELDLPIQKVSAFGGTSIRTLQKAYLERSPDRTKEVGKAIQIGTGGKLVKKGKSDA
jgi:integrase